MAWVLPCSETQLEGSVKPAAQPQLLSSRLIEQDALKRPRNGPAHGAARCGFLSGTVSLMTKGAGDGDNALGSI